MHQRYVQLLAHLALLSADIVQVKLSMWQEVRLVQLIKVQS